MRINDMPENAVISLLEFKPQTIEGHGSEHIHKIFIILEEIPPLVGGMDGYRPFGEGLRIPTLEKTVQGAVKRPGSGKTAGLKNGSVDQRSHLRGVPRGSLKTSGGSLEVTPLLRSLLVDQ